MKNPAPQTEKSITLYILLQSLTLFGCWVWFAGLWAIAFFSYGPADLEWWLLIISASAGLYGLRPNLERAIDTAWLQGIGNAKALAERAAILRPIKRRIDLICSLIVVGIILFGTVLLLTGIVQFTNV